MFRRPAGPRSMALAAGALEARPAAAATLSGEAQHSLTGDIGQANISVFTKGLMATARQH